MDVPEETPGFVVVNLYSHWQAFEQFTLEAGVENLLDKKYAYHVNKASVDPFDPTAIRVNEPGRQYWVRMRYTFSRCTSFITPKPRSSGAFLCPHKTLNFYTINYTLY